MRGSFRLDENKMRSMLRRVAEVNVDKSYFLQLIQFQHKNQALGYLKPDFAQILLNYGRDRFLLHPEKNMLSFNEVLESASLEEKTAAVSDTLIAMKQDGHIKGWRNELLPIVSRYGEEPYFLLERAATTYFGTKSYGVHINGYTRSSETGQIHSLWVAKRSLQKSTWPGMLDHIVAGGQPHGLQLIDNVIKECEEEASIPKLLASQAQAVGAISYNGIDEWGNLKRDGLFCFDLELPLSFQPQPLDGEVEYFQLQDLTWVIDKIVEGGPTGYKPNCNLVVIDFLIR
jgi:8-oxo-dGTP pyrophosphatase MutT (NUDIX family)